MIFYLTNTLVKMKSFAQWPAQPSEFGVPIQR
jgi:hypothetical protein